MTCPTCGGSGRVRDLMFEEWDPCDLCKTTGQVEPSHAFNHVGDSRTLVLHFPTKDALLDFKTWLSDGGGEQAFLDPQQMLIEQGDMTPADRIDRVRYHTGDNTVIFEHDPRCD